MLKLLIIIYLVSLVTSFKSARLSKLYCNKDLKCLLTDKDYENNLVKRLDLFDNFEKYSREQNYEKQYQYLFKIKQYLDEKKLLENLLENTLYEDSHDNQYVNLLKINRYFVEKNNDNKTI